MSLVRLELVCPSCEHTNAPGTVLCYRCGHILGKPKQGADDAQGAIEPVEVDEGLHARGVRNPLPAPPPDPVRQREAATVAERQPRRRNPLPELAPDEGAVAQSSESSSSSAMASVLGREEKEEKPEKPKQRDLCLSCGYENPPGAGHCSMCGDVWELEGWEEEEAEPDADAAEPRHTPLGFTSTVQGRPTRRRGVIDRPILGAPAPVFYLVVGAAIAALIGFAPYLGYPGLALRTIVHELGHTAIAWLLGCPTFPSLAPGSHHAAQHGTQIVAIAMTAWGFLIAFAWVVRDNRFWCAVFLTVALVFPAAVFTDLGEVFLALGGHLTELAVGVLLFWRTLVGGFTRHGVERGLYAAMAWYLIGYNVALSAGVLWDNEVYHAYLQGDSSGLMNDYLRAAQEVFHTSLRPIAGLMLGLSLLSLPLPCVLARYARR